MKKIQISEAKFRQLVREEGEKIKKEIILTSMLNKIDSELKEIDEVHAGGNMAPGKDGVHAGQKTPVFTKKGTHLVEDQDDDMEIEMDGDEMGGEEMGGETIDKASVMAAIQSLGNQLSLDGVIEFSNEAGEDQGDDMEIEIDGEEMGAEAGEEAGEEVGEEAGEEVGVDIENDAEDAEGSEEEEEVEECETDEARNLVSEKEAEETEEQRSVVSENKTKKNKLNEEAKRWKFLAGLK